MTDFRYEVDPPNPDAETLAGRKQGTVTAFLDDVEAGYLAFGVGPGEGVVSVTRVETHERFRRQHCATGMAYALRDAYPACRIIDGGGSNSEVGDLLRAALEAQQNEA